MSWDVVIPKEGWARIQKIFCKKSLKSRCLLAWQRLRTLGTISRNAALYSYLSWPCWHHFHWIRHELSATDFARNYHSHPRNADNACNDKGLNRGYISAVSYKLGPSRRRGLFSFVRFMFFWIWIFGNLLPAKLVYFTEIQHWISCVNTRFDLALTLL